MNYNVESNAAFLLSVCYGIQPDVAVKMADCKGKRKKQEELVSHEVSKFFNEKYNLKKDVFLDYAEKNMTVSELSVKYKIDKLTVRRYLASCESYYLEFRGFIELGMLDYYDNERLMTFLTRYGRYYVREQQKAKENYKWYQEYLAGNISKKVLAKVTHMTPNTLCNI